MRTNSFLVQLRLQMAGLLALVGMCLPAVGQSVVITNAADSGGGTLRTAIANATNGAVITFDPGLSGAAITLASTLTINTNLTIDASPLPNGIQINGNRAVQVFSVASNSVVELNSLTITNSNGSGIYNGGTLTITNCVLSGNSADEGGGVYNDGTLTMNQCALSGNVNIVYGGGIYNAGTLTVNRCTVSGNDTYLSGGGIYNAGTMTVNQSTLAGNGGDFGGSGIDNEGTLTVNESTLSGNYNYNTAGGIYSEGTLTVNQCTLSGNNGVVGGAIYIGKGTCSINLSTLSENSAISFRGGEGGGIFNEGTLTMTNCILSGNIASLGGGIYNAGGTQVVSQCTLSGNSATNGIGGGIYNAGTMSVNQSTILGNSAVGGGGIRNDESLVVNQSTLSGNDASSTNDFDGGGGVWNYGMLTVNQSTLSGNIGCGILSSGDAADTTCFNSIIAGNSNGGSFDADIFANGDNSFYLIENFEGANIVQSFSYSSEPIVNGTYISAAPNLAPLGNYGGLTSTMPPLPGSPVIGAGSVAGNTFTNDQRGFPRTQNGLIDIGAVELPTVQPFSACPTNCWLLNPIQFNSPEVDSDGSAITGWNWNFGDTQTGAGQNPSHIYSTPGIFSPNLIVTNSLGLALAVSGPSITVLPLTIAPASIGITGSGASAFVKFSFTDASGLSFSVLATNNITAPLSTWPVVGHATESPADSGQYQFMDSNPATNGGDYYILRQP